MGGGTPNGGNGAAAPPTELEKARAKLAPFLAANQPHAKIEENVSPEGPRLAVSGPWSETGAIITLPDNYDALADALNNLYLPPSLRGMWHSDTKELEIIWTPFELPAKFKDIYGRKFVFQFEGADHECEFAPPSRRLFLIAEYFLPIGLSDADHRNLLPFRQFIEWEKLAKASPDIAAPPGKPVSFWIRNVQWNEEKVVRMARHLNFYMPFYDELSPAIIIQAPRTPAQNPPNRYLEGVFPKHIRAHSISEDLLLLWDHCRGGDAGRRFVNYYRIIEYASLVYVDAESRAELRKMLLAPSALSDVGDLIERIIGAAVGNRTVRDIRRIDMLLQEAVDPKLIWMEILQNRTEFEHQVKFDGGYVLKPLLDTSTKEEGFISKGMEQFAKAAREIRNHLSHGRDEGTRTSITPTVANFRRLEPWVPLMRVCAGQVIVFKGLR